MIKRPALAPIRKLAKQFPAVFILGPRQCGKTTLARNYLKGEYFDLERPSDQQVFMGDIELALSRIRGPVMIDEAQTIPRLFPILRSMIDERRKQMGRYYLLGSVNPALLRHVSESLAGRVGVYELTPFLFPEVADRGLEIEQYWLRGGYPDACLEKNESKWRIWQENYVRTFIERDVPRRGLRISPIQMRLLMGMLAHHHGGILNASELGRSLGVSYHTVNDYLDILEGHYLIRRLPPYFPNLKKRMVKFPKVYIRDNGVLHYLLGISSERHLLESPQRGNSWESLVIEQVIALERALGAASRFYFYRTHAGAEIDLIVDRGRERIGYEIKCSLSADRRDWGNLKRGIEEGVISRAFLIYLGERDYPVSDRIEVLCARDFFLGYASRRW